MSSLKTPSNIFLEAAELSRMLRFLDSDGFRKALLANTVRFGIIYNKIDSTQALIFNDLKVEQGTNAGTIKINGGSAIDKFGNFIVKLLEDNIAIPNDGNWYWVKAKYRISNEEVGTVNVDASGLMTGVNTKFTEVLRGQPNFPARVRLSNSINNILEYDVLEVTSDTSAQLNVNTFVAENNLKYKVVGTFTPGYVVPDGDKFPFNYDDCILMSLGNGVVQEIALNTRPNYLQNEEFYIARVKNNNGTMQIEDKRLDVWKPKADFQLEELLRVGNAKILGIESVQWDNKRSDGNDNVVTIGWGVTSSSWTTNTSARIVSLLSIAGGRMKSSVSFTNGDFNFHRLYLPNGKFIRILNSVKNGTQVDLSVDSLDPDDFVGGGNLIVVPDAEEVEFHFIAKTDETAAVALENEFHFTRPIADGFGKFRLPIWNLNTVVGAADANRSRYYVTYRFKTFKTYTPWLIPPFTMAYYNELAFDVQGTLVDNTKQTQYAEDGYVTLQHKANNYYDFVQSITTGDKFGVLNRQMDNQNPIVNLLVGRDLLYQHVYGVINLSTDHVFDLSIAGARNGNRFFINFDNSIVQGTFRILITQGYQNPGSLGTILYEFADNITNNIKGENRKRLLVRCEFDGQNWIVFPHVSVLPIDLAKCDDVWKDITLKNTTWVQAAHGADTDYTKENVGGANTPSTPQYRIDSAGKVFLRGAFKLVNFDFGSTYDPTDKLLVGQMDDLISADLISFKTNRHMAIPMSYDNYGELHFALLKVTPDGLLTIYHADTVNTNARIIHAFIDGIVI